MKWSDRQLAMLREMGIRLWPKGEAAPASADEELQANAPQGIGDLAAAVAERLAAHEARVVSEKQERAEPSEARAAPATAPAVRSAPPSQRPAPQIRGDRKGDRAARGFTGVAPPGRETMSFPELADAASGCTACRLCETRRNVVFGTGNAHAHWMIVGDAPGEMEDEQGEPFVSKPGQLLDSMLAACGLSRSLPSTSTPPEKQVYIANALKCRPKGSSNPTPEELAHCEPYLLRQIELIQPRIILAMGRYAVQSLLHSTEPLGKLRGRVHHVHGAPDVPVVVTYHPAFLLRNGEDKARAWDDLCLAMEAVGG